MMMYLESLSNTVTSNMDNGATFRAEGTEFFGIKVVMTKKDWIEQGRPTWIDLTIGRD